jgi:hypothetical protein
MVSFRIVAFPTLNVMAMENLIDILIIAFLAVGVLAFFGAYGIGVITLRAAINACAALFGVSSFAIWARREKGKTFSPKVRPPHDDKSDDEKRHAS